MQLICQATCGSCRLAVSSNTGAARIERVEIDRRADMQNARWLDKGYERGAVRCIRGPLSTGL